MRAVAFLVVVVLALAQTEWPLPSEATADDDVCSVDPSGEGCALALRQLRGVRSAGYMGLEAAGISDTANVTSRAEENVSENASTNATSGADEGGEEANSFCCYSGAVASDVCGSCFPTAIAESGSFCASKGNCGGCGGTWCKKRFHCAFSGADSSDICGTAYSTAIAEVGSFCDRSEAQCSACQGKWCPIVVADAPSVTTAEPSVALLADAVENASTNPTSGVAENASTNATSGADEGGEEANSFCCYSGAVASDVCGSCFPTAIAESGSFCASKGNCGGCGGTWCKKRFHCAFSGADSSDICGTAYSTAIAEVGSFCDRSEAQCSACQGKWCRVVVADAPSVTTAEPSVALLADAVENASTNPTSGVAENASTNATSGADEGGEEANSFCCYSGAVASDVCGSCFPTAIAESGSFCASKGNCGGCGGTWCKKRFHCAFSGADSSDICGTAYSTAIAEVGSFCDRSEAQCSECRGKWCPTVVADAPSVTTAEPFVALLADAVENASTNATSGVAENASTNATSGADEGGEEANSFCCYSGAVASDVCGSCFPTAIAESGSFCASKGNCGGCGGTWCKKRFHCAFSGADSSDICGTAYSAAIAEVGSFCDRSEAQCSECRGKWCPIVVADAPIVPAA